MGMENKEERIPNGDISQPLKRFETELKAIVSKGKSEEPITLEDKARFIVAAKLITDAIAYYTDRWADDIREVEGFQADFVDLGKTVKLTEGSRIFEISTDIVDELTTEEIKKTAKFTEKALKEIEKDALISKYKVLVGNRNSTVKVMDLKG